MASDKKRAVDTEKENGRSSSDYYKLKTKAIEDLVTADESNSPEITPEDLKKYSKANRFTIPEWLKAAFIKFWFAGAVCFFIYMGLGNYLQWLDMLFVFGIALGMVTDILVNNIFRFYEKKPGANNRWMMLPKKNFINFFLNIIYAFILLLIVRQIYDLLNVAINGITGAEKDNVSLPVEPILFGVLYMGVDMLFIGMKRTFKKIVADAMKKAK